MIGEIDDDKERERKREREERISYSPERQL